MKIRRSSARRRGRPRRVQHLRPPSAVAVARECVARRVPRAHGNARRRSAPGQLPQRPRRRRRKPVPIVRRRPLLPSWAPSPLWVRHWPLAASLGVSSGSSWAQYWMPAVPASNRGDGMVSERSLAVRARPGRNSERRGSATTTACLRSINDSTPPVLALEPHVLELHGIPVGFAWGSRGGASIGPALRGRYPLPERGSASGLGSGSAMPGLESHTKTRSNRSTGKRQARSSVCSFKARRTSTATAH